MTTSLLTPLDFSEAKAVGRRRFWKQILPVSSIDYDGQTIDFDPQFHKDLQLAFKERAFDQIPLVFADSQNQHNMDPRNFGGDMIDLQYRGSKPGQGTWALIEADRSAARVIRRNPKLGVSARIMQGVKRDGKEFPRAINHVLLTMNPRVTGMSPWQAVDLSEDADNEVVDLTAETFKEGTDMGKTAVATRRQIDLSKLDDSQFATLIDLATATGVLDREDEAELDEDGNPIEADDEADDDEEEVVEPPRKKKKSKTKITVEKESDESGDDDEDDETDDETDDEVVNLSKTVAAMQLESAKGKWANERAEYIRNGVPPYMLDLAEPILSKPQAVIDLADGGVDAATAMRNMLDGATGLIDLTGELGHGIDLSETLEKDDPDAKFLAAWDEQYG